MALQNNHLLGSLGTLVPQVLGRAGPEGISAPKAMGGGGCAFCLQLCLPFCVLIPAGVWVLPGGTSEKKEITEHQNKEL